VDTDELLRPALTGYRRTGYKPWRLQSQIYVGFFGGALAVGAIAFANAVMLGMSVRARVAIVALALAAEAALLVAAAAITRDATVLVRFGIPVAGVIAYGGAFLIQRSADRVYQFHTDEEEPYESLFGAGLVACIVARIADAMLLGAVAE
jgi:hypothetical protein